MIRVLVAADCEILRRGLMDILGEDPDISIVSEACGRQEALEKVWEEDIDVVFSTFSCPEETAWRR